MKRFTQYLQMSFHNIRHNVLYSAFYVIGTALTFVFIVLLLQYNKIANTDTPPLLGSHRLFSVDYFFDNGKFIGFILPEDVSMFANSIPGKEKVAINRYQQVLAEINGNFKDTGAEFVGRDYFDIYQFDFVEGRAFTQEEAEAGEKKAVIKKGLADSFFPGGKAVGGKVVVQDIEYEVIGVVDDFSTFSCPVTGSIWVPAKYNTGIPSSYWWFKVDILFKPGLEKDEMKRQFTRAVQNYFTNRDIELDFTEKDAVSYVEKKQSNLGFIGGAILLLLLIPALNIVTLNMTNSYAHAAEIAIQRAIGSTRLAVFSQQMVEIFILVLVGLVVGIVLALPVIDGVQNLLLGSASHEETALIAHLDYSVVLGQVLPLAVLFAFLSGGIPVYFVTTKNIATVLKGEEGI